MASLKIRIAPCAALVTLWTTFACLALLPCLSPPAAAEPLFSQTNLVTNNQLVNPAQITDPNLVNAWGISFSPTSPFWVSDNGTGLATLYNVNSNTNATSIAALVVTIPPPSPAPRPVKSSTATPAPSIMIPSSS
jgi:hypothetical protein